MTMGRFVQRVAWGLAVLVAALAAAPALGKSEKDARRSERPPAPKSTAEDVPVYKPPIRGAPGGRIGGSTRTTEREALVVSALAPVDHAGLTRREQPTLYWFASRQTSVPLEFVLGETQSPRSLVETRLPPVTSPGIQRIALADHGIRLATGTVYRWLVAAVVDPERRSRDVLAGGFIVRIDTPEAVRGRLEAVAPSRRPFVDAAEGLWYDAVATLSDLVEQRPADPAPRRQRAALLEQVGLTEAAEFELRGVCGGSRAC
jgi:hypothetical protein